MEEQIVYFEKPGQENTSAVFDVVDRALGALETHKVIRASTRGDTARFAMDLYKGQDVRLIVVPHHAQVAMAAGDLAQDLVEDVDVGGAAGDSRDDHDSSVVEQGRCRPARTRRPAPHAFAATRVGCDDARRAGSGNDQHATVIEPGRGRPV